MIRFRPLALSALLLASFAYAQPPRYHRDAKPLHIIIDTIPHSEQRHPTVGDWQIDKAGNLHITVSKMSRQDFEIGVAIHQLVEAVLCDHAGITPDMVDKFDMEYEARRRPGDKSEPGDSKYSPLAHHC